MRWLCLSLLLCACPSAEPEPEPTPAPEPIWLEATSVDGPIAAWDGDDVYVGDGLRTLSGDLVPSWPEDGPFTWLGRAGASLYAHVHESGLYRLDGGQWATVERPGLPLPGLFNPRAAPVPFGIAEAGGVTWLATIGGVLRSDDGLVFETVAVGASGSLNVLFTDVIAFDDEVWVVAQLADSMLPAQYAGVLTGTVFHSADGGATWAEVGDGLGAMAPMSLVRRSNGDVCVASMDAGVSCREGGAWTAKTAPIDAVAVDEANGRLVVGLVGGGLMVEHADGWHTTDTAPIVGLNGGEALAVDGGRYVVAAGEDASAEPGDATVHVALSFHVNLYHSYRGDTYDDDGYGMDLRVMRTALDWLDERPGVRADWDIENHFSLDGWLQTDGADVLLRLQDRVADGVDDVRLMSWNNGAMASSTRSEFDESVSRGLESLEASFGRVVPGVQPQENMITPEHLGWYAEQGIDWVTLFYSSNGFTGPRMDIELEGRALHNPVTLTDPKGGELLWLPVYHHADVLDHGGLAAWARQLRRTNTGDVLLAIHFDADAETWENFDREIDAVASEVEAGEVVFTTIQDYIDDHGPVATVELPGDQADGTGDGFQSWAEKDFNHRLATRIVEARTLAQQAEVIGAGDPAVEAELDTAQTTRLLALSTTHFGLAAPYLADDRVLSAWEFADQAVGLAQGALELASEPVPAGTIEVTEWRGRSGPALIDLPLTVPVEEWVFDDAVAIFEDGVELPVWVQSGNESDGLAHFVVSFVLDMQAFETRTLTWAVDDDFGRPGGALNASDAVTAWPGGVSPFTECDGDRSVVLSPTVDTQALADGLVLRTRSEWPTNACGEFFTSRADLVVFDGLPGTVVRVDQTLPLVPSPDDLESVVLTPLSCDGPAYELQWRTFGGQWRTRAPRRGSRSWNGLSVDGAMAMVCGDGAVVSVAHRVAERTSLGFAPYWEEDGDSRLAPLGTLWGPGPYHRPRRTGGSGLGEVVTTLVGAQYRPAAPDWAGQTVRYTLLVGDDLSPDVLDLFAHPPLVRVGE